MSRFNELFNTTVFQDGNPDAILNISVISNATYLKIQPYVKDQQNFSFLLWDFTKLLTK